MGGGGEQGMLFVASTILSSIKRQTYTSDSMEADAQYREKTKKLNTAKLIIKAFATFKLQSV